MKISLLPRFPSPRRYKVPRDLELGAVVPKSCGQSGRSFNRCREVARMFGFQSRVRHFLYITPNTDMDRVELGRYQWYQHHVVIVTTKESYLNGREIMTRNPFHSFDYTVFVSILEPVFTNLRPHEYKNHPLRRCWQCFASNERKKKAIPKEVFDFDHTILTRPLRSHSHLFGLRFTYKSESYALAKIPFNVWSTQHGCLGAARGA